MARGTTLAARWPHEPESQSATSQRGCGFYTLRGGIDPEDHRFRPPVVGIVDVWKDLLSGDATIFSLGCADSIHGHQSISHQLVGLGFPHRAGRCRLEGTPFLSPGCRSCTCMEGSMIRVWEPILPGMRWLYVLAPANQRSAGGAGVSTPYGAVSTLGFPRRAGRCRPEGNPFLSPGCRSCTCMEGSMIRVWEPILPGMRWLYVLAPTNRRSAGGAGVSTPCGAVSTRGIAVFVPGLLEL